MNDDLDRALDNLEKGLKSADERHLAALKHIDRAYRNVRIAMVLIVGGGIINIAASFGRLYYLRNRTHQVQQRLDLITRTNAVQAEAPDGR
jgi:hypothetical protein